VFAAPSAIKFAVEHAKAVYIRESLSLPMQKHIALLVVSFDQPLYLTSNHSVFAAERIAAYGDVDVSG